MTALPDQAPMDQRHLPPASRHLDALIHARLRKTFLMMPSGPVADGLPVPHYTTSIDAALGLVREKLPGWVWRLCECSVTDDVWLMPDYCHPERAAEFGRRWPEQPDPFHGTGPGVDVSYDPPGRPAIGMVNTLLIVLDGIANDAPPDYDSRPLWDLLSAAEQA